MRPVCGPRTCPPRDEGPAHDGADGHEPRPWAFHCHILNHVEGPEGMFGMVTALVVQ
jgi:hypothetical protein